MERFKEKIKALPNQTGVYFMKDQLGNIIYIGKSKNLKERVRQYFQASRIRPPKIEKMIVNIADIDYLTTDTELEALILECRLIKQYKPMYNTLMKKYRTYPYIKISIIEKYPRVMVDYEVKDDGWLYFGPYTRRHCVETVILWLEEHYPIRRCRQLIGDHKTSLCLYGRLGKCLAPCRDKEVKQKYNQIIQEVIDFLDGKNQEPLIAMEKKMKKAAEEMAFEEAMKYKTQLNALRHVSRKHNVAKMALKEQSIVAFEHLDTSKIKVFFIRYGQLEGHDKIDLDDLEDHKMHQELYKLVEEHYRNRVKVRRPTRHHLAQAWVDEAQIIESWLSNHDKTYLILDDKQDQGTRRNRIMSIINKVLEVRKLT